jgi:hypothetical protein
MMSGWQICEQSLKNAPKWLNDWAKTVLPETLVTAAGPCDWHRGALISTN